MHYPYSILDVILPKPVEQETYRESLQRRLCALGYDFKPCSEAEMEEWMAKATALLVGDRVK